MESIFEKVKSAVRIADVVEHFGVHLNSRNKGLCPFHEEKTGSFSVKRDDNIYSCFGCGESGDAIDFVAKLKGIEPLEAARLLANIFHIDIGEKTARNAPVSRADAKNRQVAAPQNLASTRDTKPNAEKITQYIKDCIKAVGKTDYFARRGLTEETVKRFFLGYDERRKAVVLPYSSKLQYYQSRSVLDKSFFKPKTEDAGAEPLFNREILWKTKQPIFVVESPICALSVMQSGGAAVSLCGTNGSGKLVKECKAKKPTGILVLCLDNDEPGQKASQELANQLYELDVRFEVCNIADQCKDPNELLTTDAARLASNVASAIKKAKQKYKTDKDSFSAYELQGSEITPPNWIVKDILPQGLAIISAPSKTGKSWMMLQLAAAVCEGGAFLGYPTEQAGCLYYALEDSKFRLKDRINKMLCGAAAPKKLYLAIKADPLDGGLLERLTAELEENACIKLVIIDTLQKVRGKSSKTETAYTSDYREMSALKDFADKRKICILLVHHLRKMTDDNDVFNMISGSNGIMGACDTIFILSKKKRADENATLSMTGRDIRQTDLVVHFNTEKYRWEVVGTPAEEQRKREEREYAQNPIVKVVKYLVEQPPYEWCGTATELMKAYHDMTGEPCPLTPVSIGKEISNVLLKLYYDGIDHKERRSGATRKHVFFKRREYMKQYQSTLWSDRYDKNDTSL